MLRTMALKLMSLVTTKRVAGATRGFNALSSKLVAARLILLVNLVGGGLGWLRFL